MRDSQQVTEDDVEESILREPARDEVEQDTGVDLTIENMRSSPAVICRLCCIRGAVEKVAAVPQGGKRIAQPFIAGSPEMKSRRVPEGQQRARPASVL